MAVEVARAFIGLDEHARAVPELERVLESFQQMGTWADRAATQDVLGDAHHGLGDLAETRHWWAGALADCELHEHPYAEKVRAELAALPGN